jgi:hypothetical protein
MQDKILCAEIITLQVVNLRLTAGSNEKHQGNM